MKLSKEARKLSRQLFKASFTDGKLDAEKIRAQVTGIAVSKPRRYLDLLKSYQRLLRLETEKHHAIVESASELNNETRAKIQQSLQAKQGGDLTVDFKINPELIGGLRVQIGNDVWNGSVQGRLERLQEELTAA